MANDFQVGEDWTDSIKNLNTSGTLASGTQTITGNIDASGTITGAALVQGAQSVLDNSDLDDNGGTILQTSNMLNAGLSAPISPIAGTFWYDTTTHILKIRDETNAAWLSIWDLANNKPIITNLSTEILTAMIADSQITTAKIADINVTTAKIKDANVTNAKMAADAIDTIEIIDSAVTEAKLANAAKGVIVSANDTTMGYLNGKLVAGDNVSLVEGNDGADETLTIDKVFRGVFVGRNVAETVLATATKYVTWTTAKYDTDSFITLPATQLFIPPDISRIRVAAQVTWAATATPTGLRLLSIILSQSGTYTYAKSTISTGTDFNAVAIPVQLITPILDVVAGSYIILQVYNGDSADMDISGDTDIKLTWINIEVIE